MLIRCKRQVTQIASVPMSTMGVKRTMLHLMVQQLLHPSVVPAFLEHMWIGCKRHAMAQMMPACSPVSCTLTMACSMWQCKVAPRFTWEQMQPVGAVIKTGAELAQNWSSLYAWTLVELSGREDGRNANASSILTILPKWLHKV